VTIDESTIHLTGEAVRLDILTLGATLRRFDVRLPDGTWRNILLGHPSDADYVSGLGYLGASVGRFANRIGGARFTLEGTEYVLDANEGPNQLHGGPAGFASRKWDVAGLDEDWVELVLVSPDGDQGFPGEVRVSALFELVEGGAQVTYRATTDAPTVVNLTTHPYFNLDGEASGDTDFHQLRVPAGAYTPNTDDGIPTGEIRDVTGSAADFRVGRLLGPAREHAAEEGITRNGGYDHNFVVDGTGLREHCRFTGASGLTLTLRSDAPALQVYTGEHFAGLAPGTSGVPYVRRAGVALEPQGFPDAPNHENFPGTVLRPGEEYVTTTQWLVG
jgi:aldose 1-epimerase